MSFAIVKVKLIRQGRVTMDEKDRLGTKLQEKGRADEDRYFAQRDREALEKIKQSSQVEASKEALMRCPKCGTKLKSVEHHGVTVEECPSCQGLWLDRGELEALSQRENEGWVSRFSRRSLSS
jgi:ribosomal protein L37AE/L43A